MVAHTLSKSPPVQAVLDPASAETWSPLVTVVIPTRDRPELLRRALESVLAQDLPADLEVLVVVDGAAPPLDLPSGTPGRGVRVLTNDRAPGLAGTRNTGILAAAGDWVAFCDDDDHWLPGKLGTQLSVLDAHPEVEMITTAMVVDWRGRRTVRLAHRDCVEHQDLLRSRMAMLHSSSFLIRRTALLDGIGLVEESLPGGGMSEDWDLLLRASRRQPIAHVDAPLVVVEWGRSSFFSGAWADRNLAHLWLIDHHPEIAQDRPAAALMYGKVAYGCAVLGRRREAVSWALRSIAARWREPRGYLALASATGVLPAGLFLDVLNRHGHGI